MAEKKMDRPNYIDNIHFSKDVLLDGGSVVHCYHLENAFDEPIINEWALRIRREYISDENLDLISKGVDREQFLRDKIPTKTIKYGPRTISGEFAEIIAADFRRFVLNENVFGSRNNTKATPASPIQGCDIVSCLVGEEFSEKDELIMTESKSFLSSTNYSVLLEAAKDSEKDSLRIGFTLAFYAGRFAELKMQDQLDMITRFINRAQMKCIEKYEGSCITIDKTLNEVLIKSSMASYVGNPKEMYFIYGIDLMDLAHRVYERALKC